MTAVSIASVRPLMRNPTLICVTNCHDWGRNRQLNYWFRNSLQSLRDVGSNSLLVTSLTALKPRKNTLKGENSMGIVWAWLAMSGLYLPPLHKMTVL